MKTYAKSILISGILGSTSIVAQTSNGQFEQWYRAKYGRPSPSEQARLTTTKAATDTTQTTIAVSANAGSEQWYRAKYGRPSPTEEARLQAQQANAGVPAMTAPAVAVSGNGAEASVMQTPAGERLSKLQLDTLIASAKSPAEHEQIAKVYQSEAQDYLAQAQEHEAMVAAYKATPSLSAKNEAATLNHCEYFAAKFRELAAKSQETARLHEEMAREAGQK